MSDERRIFMHWPILVLGIVVALIFLVVLFVFQVEETNYAVLVRFGRPLTALTDDGDEVVRVYDPGLHLKIPFVDSVWRHDRRLHCYDLTRGQTEQMQTADNYQVIISTFVLWRVGDPYTFLTAVETTAEAEARLDPIVRNARNNVIGGYALEQLINVDAEKVLLGEIEAEILAGVREIAMHEYGIDVRDIGIRHLGFPQQVTQTVFERMRAERQRRAEEYLAEGRSTAQTIRSGADLSVERILADAEAQATQIRAEGDKAAAEFYAVFRRNPELAAFLRKLESLRRTLGERTTLVLDTNTPPFDLFLPNAIDFSQLAEIQAGTGEQTAGDGEQTTEEAQ